MATETHRELPRWNVHLKDPKLVIIDPNVTLGDLGSPFAERLHFRSRQHDAAFESVQDLKVVSGASIGGDDTVTAYFITLFCASLLNLLGSGHEASVPKSGRGFDGG